MANQYAPVAATQVGSYFVQQYYQMFKQQREFVHQFYNDSSSMVRIDGEITHSASDVMHIHQTIMSLNFTGIEIKTINSLESWGGGVLVFVSGTVKSRSLSGSRKFVQTFFLAPQEQGYFVLNDMFHFADEGLEQHYSAAVAQDLDVDINRPCQPTFPIFQRLCSITVSDYQLEEEARVNLISTHISDRGEPVPEYSYSDQHEYEPEPEPEPELVAGAEPESRPERESNVVEEGTRFEDSSVLLHSSATMLQEPRPSVEEPPREPEKLTYASILRAKGKLPPPVSSAAFTPKPVPDVDWNHQSQPLPLQPTPSPLNSCADTVEESTTFEEGKSLSVYVRNLSSVVTSLDIVEEFKIFGEIKHDGVFLRNREDTGVCYAFVEFEDVESVHNALKASPIQLAGRQVYIEERRPNTGASRGGRRGGGRGRGSGRGRSFGRGSESYSSDNNRFRTNGFRT